MMRPETMRSALGRERSWRSSWPWGRGPGTIVAVIPRAPTLIHRCIQNIRICSSLLESGRWPGRREAPRKLP